MARLRQQYPNNYLTSGNISTEFENLVRYLNVGELGNKTLGELLTVLFDSDGVFQGPIEMRLDSTLGLQYRVGTYAGAETGWVTLSDIASLRGTPGADLGTIGAPILYSRQDTTAIANQTIVDYAHVSTDELLVYRNGYLKREGSSHDYTKSHTAGTGGAGAVTFTTALLVNDTVSIYKIRADNITGFLRTDTDVVAPGQTVFPFVHDADTVLQVYENGILQREGGGNDYTTSPSSDTVTFTSTVSANDLVSIVTVENVGDTVISGLMLESRYTDTSSGLIDYPKLSIAADEIPQAKVDGLVAALTASATLTIAATAPVSPAPASGNLWHDTSITPNELKFWNGTSWLSTAAEQSIPTFASTNARQYLQVTQAGTALQWTDVDVSSLVPKTYMGAANGVAKLDSLGRLSQNQLPTTLITDSIYHKHPGNVTNADYVIKRMFKDHIQVVGMSIRTASGTCNVQLMKGGVLADQARPAGVTAVDSTFATAVDIDASAASVTLGFQVTGASSPTDLEVTFAIKALT